MFFLIGCLIGFIGGIGLASYLQGDIENDMVETRVWEKNKKFYRLVQFDPHAETKPHVVDPKSFINDQGC